MATTTPITSNWQKYFDNPDEGLGTTYERFVLHNYFRRFKTRYSVRTILEAPSFGMTGVSGINSLWWAQQGVEVTIIDQCLERMQSIQKVWSQTGLPMKLVYQSAESSILPFGDRSFDMAWNFAALWYASDGDAYLRELSRVAKSALFICVPNPHNICWVTRPDDATDVDMDYINTDWIISTLAGDGWRVAERGFLDVPPWPHIELRKEEMLRRIGLGRIAQALEAKNAGVCIVDYFTGKSPAMERQILKYSFLEYSPSWLKKMWAHHCFLVFDRAHS